MDEQQSGRRFPMRLLLYGALLAGLGAIVVPSLLRARRSSGESPHIGYLRSMMSGQAAYQGANGGFYDHPRCLVQPQSCIPGYKPGGATFLDPSYLQELRYGYRWTFHAGPPAPADSVRAGHVSPSSLAAWAYVAVPAEGGAGRRGFCADGTGILCMTSDGLTPPVDAGACVIGTQCHVLR